MATIDEMIDLFESLDYEALAADVIEDNANDVEQVNRNQLLRGENALGTKIKPSYRSEKYSRAKNTINPLAGFGNPDLKKTGELHRQIDVKVFGKNMVDIFSRDDKAEDLVAKYGEEIFGLQDDELPALRANVLYPKLIDLICLKTGAKAD